MNVYTNTDAIVSANDGTSFCIRTSLFCNFIDISSIYVNKLVNVTKIGAVLAFCLYQKCFILSCSREVFSVSQGNLYLGSINFTEITPLTDKC